MSDPSEALVLLDIADGIANIRFNRPRQLNAITVEMATGFHQAALQASQDASVRVIVLSGAGRAFMAGGDLGYFRAAGEQAPQAARVLIEPIHAAVAILAQASQPVLASLHGAVAGAGMSLALGADLAIAADDVVFNLAYVNVGNSPDCSASWTLPRIVGLRKALEIALLADNIDAAEALRLGLVNRVVPAASLPDETQKLARRMARSAPLAMAGIKRLMRVSLEHPIGRQLDEEAASFASIAGSADFREALAAFFDKRKPEFTGK
jgi:2-(1,2-epoxy-1,2-dihydrophenyl)acetyl-CoA isomerase